VQSMQSALLLAKKDKMPLLHDKVILTHITGKSSTKYDMRSCKAVTVHIAWLESSGVELLKVLSD